MAPIIPERGALPDAPGLNVIDQQPFVALNMPPHEAVSGERQALIQGLTHLCKVYEELNIDIV